MKHIFRSLQWRKHIPALAFLFICFLAAVASGVFHFSESSQLAMRSNLLDQQKRTNRRGDQASHLLDEQLPIYYRLKDRHILGEPDRLQWIETLRRLSKELNLPELKFQLKESRLADETSSVFYNGQLKILETPMQVSFRLNHEGEFITVLRQLSDRANGLFNVENCDLNREVSELPPVRKLLVGNCDLRWYTVEDVGAGSFASR